MKKRTHLRICDAFLIMLAMGVSLAASACGPTDTEVAPLASPAPAVEPEPGETNTAPAVTRETRPKPQPEDPVTLYWNLGGEPSTLDPVLVTDQASLDCTANLFVGLTRWDPITSEALPYLAAGWDVSGDGLVYTFYLRDDILWVKYDPATETVESQGPVTAHDVEYGIKRAVDPDTGSDYAHVLYLIRNAGPVHMGVAGATLDEVGVRALDQATVEFTLEEPAAYFPSILAMWVAKPQPQQLLAARGDAWTELEAIWTNGPYLITGWTAGQSMRFEKNPFWPQADQVQIEVVDAIMVVDPAAEFALYQANQLGAARVPLTDLRRVRQDPFLSQEVVRQMLPCTYYYGFTTTKPPFDDVRVRTAFSAAIDRPSLIEEVLQDGGQIPATTFAPPGTVGAPAPGTVGLGYDPGLARASLQEFLDEMGLADADAFSARYDIVLGHNTGESHSRVAAAVQEMWADTLGVHVRVSDRDWTDYLEITTNTTPLEQAFHIFRMGWCADYPDENNWLRQVFHYQDGSNRVRRRCADPNCATLSGPALFDRVVMEAARETDPAIRAELYARAEDLLARQEVAAAFIYHHAANMVAKPWLHRDYILMGGANWYDWTIDWEKRSSR